MSKTFADAVRFVKTRDAATSILRKLGIKPRDYNFFIEKTTGEKLAVQIAVAQAHLQALTQPAKPAPKAPEPKATETKAPKTRARSCSSAARELILAGKTNDEVWAAISAEFDLDAKKRGYPAWYRFQLRKQGHKV
jgi:hypothetical protein